MRCKLSLLAGVVGVFVIALGAALGWGGHAGAQVTPTSTAAPGENAPAVIASVTVGSDPFAVAVDPSRNRIYVGDYGGNDVSVIDGATNTVVDTVGVGSPQHGVAVDPVANRLYVSSVSGDYVSIVDLAATPEPTVVATVAVAAPHDLAVDPIAHLVYVAGYFDCTVSIIDGAATPQPTVVATVTASGNRCNGVAFNPNANHFYLGGATAGTSDNHVTVFDAATKGIITTLSVGDTDQEAPWGAAVNPDAGRVYVARLDGAVSVIDAVATPLPTVVATVGVGNTPVNVAVNAVTNRIYVTNSQSGTVSVIDGGASPVPKVVATVTLDGNPWGIAVNPSTNRVYVSERYTSTVWVLQDSAPVGGAAEYPDRAESRLSASGSSSLPYAALAGAAAGVVALAAGGWYARRRRRAG